MIKRLVFARDLGGVEINRQSTEDMQGSKNALHHIIVIRTCHYTFAQHPKMYDTKKEP